MLVIILAVAVALYVGLIAFMTFKVCTSPNDGPEQMKEVDISDELLPEAAKASVLSRLEPFEALGFTFLGCFLANESEIHASYVGVMLDEARTTLAYLNVVVGQSSIEMNELVTDYLDGSAIHTNDSLKILIDDEPNDAATYPDAEPERLVEIHRARVNTRRGAVRTIPVEHPAWFECLLKDNRAQWEQALDKGLMRRRADGQYVPTVWPTFLQVISNLAPFKSIRAGRRIRRSNRILESLRLSAADA